MPATGFEDYGEPTSYNGKSINEKNVGDPSQEQPSKARQYGYQGTDVSLENLGWRTINGPFVSVWLHNVPWGGEDTMAAPDAKVGLLRLLGNCTLHLLFLLLSFVIYYVYLSYARGASGRFNLDLMFFFGNIYRQNEIELIKIF